MPGMIIKISIVAIMAAKWSYNGNMVYNVKEAYVCYFDSIS